MAEVTRNERGEIVKVTYRDPTGYSAEVERASGDTIRIWTKAPGGNGGAPVDLPKPEARRFAHDIADLVDLED